MQDAAVAAAAQQQAIDSSLYYKIGNTEIQGLTLSHTFHSTRNASTCLLLKLPNVRFECLSVL